jgi:hypothetical protein
MIEPNIFAAIAMTVLWPAGIAYCTVKYFGARKRGAKVESWFWFLAWCAVLSMIEWFVWFALSLACAVTSAACLA